jgi:type I restriction enzyme S subunit
MNSWDKKCLGDLLDRPLAYGVLKPGPYEQGGIPLIRIQDHKGGVIAGNSLHRIPFSLHQEFKRTELREGDIIISVVGTIGRTAIVPKQLGGANVSRAFAVISCSSEVDTQFLDQYLRSSIAQAWFKEQCQGNAQQVLNLGTLREHEIPLPPLPEQKKIAEILSGIDRAIARERSMLLKIDHAIQAVRDKTQSCHGEERKIGNLISKISTGVSVNGENRPCRPSEQGVLKVSCVSKGEFLPSENKVIDEENKGRATMSIKKGMLLVSRANTPELVGACGITRNDHDNLFLPDKIWNLEIQESSGCSKRWLNNALNSQLAKARIRDASTGTSDSMRNISQSNFCEIDILVPPLDIQQQQSDLIDSFLRRKQIIATKMEIHLLLKAALSAELLSGRKRVSV